MKPHRSRHTEKGVTVNLMKNKDGEKNNSKKLKV
jgi:hypothetical protein